LKRAREGGRGVTESFKLDLGTGAGKASVRKVHKDFLVRLFSSHWDATAGSNLGVFNSKMQQMKIFHSSVINAQTAGWDTRTSTLSAQSECQGESEPISPLL